MKNRSVCFILSLFMFSSIQVELYSEQTTSSGNQLSSAQQNIQIEENQPSAFTQFNSFLGDTLFFDLSGGAFHQYQLDEAGQQVLDEKGNPIIEKEITLPFMIVFLIIGPIFFTFLYGFVNIRLFPHALQVIRGKYDNPKDEGEISHFKALTSALSATVGLGNIAGVAVAIQLGGPGAVLWMVLLAFFGMSAKFGSCTLALMFRKTNQDGTISGGPMYYLDLGLKEKGPGFAVLGKVLAIMAAVMCMFGAIGAGNMFQSNQTAEAFNDTYRLSGQCTFSQEQYQKLKLKFPEDAPVLEKFSQVEDDQVVFNYYTFKDLNRSEEISKDCLAALGEKKDLSSNIIIGIIMAVFVGLVIIGGIKRIGQATSKIVPLMCGMYVTACLYVLICNVTEIPSAIMTVFDGAFHSNAAYGGFVGVLVQGLRRAAFSNESGLGSASIAHAAAKTDEPIREGVVAMIGPFIDTIVICFMTASVIVITGAWSDPTIPAKAGVTLTNHAFSSEISWFPYLLTVCILLFAYSTMISWCYYGERAWIYLMDHFNGMGLKTVIIYQLFFVVCVVLGAVAELSNIVDFSDYMLLSMVFPNVIGSLFLAPKVCALLKDYTTRLKNGEIQTFK